AGITENLIAAAVLLLVLLGANSLRQKMIQRKTVPPPPPADARAFPIPPLPGTAAPPKETADA
ncbi:NADH-quinone oxidoreductase subunit H, partial [Mycolicibacterium sphagni]|nr:NADH-quinone oxidoreductase subunit H [Mycolicibacterium sphagni]